MVTAVVGENGAKGMPTCNIRKVRRMLADGRAEIVKYRPFTIKILGRTSFETQPIELCEDTGKLHAGVSVKSEKHEYWHEQRDFLEDEKQRHDECRKLRRSRRGRKRYRQPRFDNRKRSKGWIAPSLENVMERHVDVAKEFAEVVPITTVYVELGSFDTQKLEAIERGDPVPVGMEYQNGARSGLETLRAAVFYRDGHKCLICGKGEVPLRAHHIGYWKTPPDRSNRMGNMASVCVKCHVPRNHAKSGKLHGWAPEVKPLTGAAFMNVIRWRLKERLEEEGFDVRVTYGADTKAERSRLKIAKTHANDAYCMGEFRPKRRARERVFAKRRRNSRILEKFYDAKYVDVRDGKEKSGVELSCGRTNRSDPRKNPGDERPYRARKTSKGRRSIRRNRYPVRPGDVILVGGKKIVTTGTQSKGASLAYAGVKEIPIAEASPVVDAKTKKPLPIEPGGRIVYNGKRRKVTRVTKDAVWVEWQMTVATTKAKVVRHADGWVETTKRPGD